MDDSGDNLKSGLGNTQGSMVSVTGSAEARLNESGIRPIHDHKSFTNDAKESENSDDFFGPSLQLTVSEESSGDGPPRRVSGQLCNYHDMKVVWWDETGRRERLSDIEDVEKYVPGGFHPVDIHDTLHGGRYEVIAKLGHGGYGIVWLCRDLKKNVWRAVKILTAAHSRKRTTDWKAVQMLQDAGATREQWEAAHIQLPIDHFWAEGPNGRHMCLVLPLLGRNLKSVPEAEPHVLKSYLLQVARGLQFLHERNIGHGDIRPHNILLKLGDISNISKTEMMPLLGAPVKEIIRRVSNEFPREYAPTYVVEPADISCLPTTNEVSIIDFGVSFHADHRHKRIGIPSQFAAPESLFGCYPGLGADVWAFICTISDVLTGRGIFKGEKADYLFYLEVLLGPLIEPYRTAFLEEWDRTPLLQQKLPNIKMIDDTAPRGKLSPLSTTYAKLEAFRRVHMDDTVENSPESFTKIIASKHFLRPEHLLADGRQGSTDQPHISSSDEIRMLADLFGKVLKYDVKERLTINEVIKHTWFRTDLSEGDNRQKNTEGFVFEHESVTEEITMPRERTTPEERYASEGSIPEDLLAAKEASVSESSIPEAPPVTEEGYGSEEGNVSEDESLSDVNSVSGQRPVSTNGSVPQGNVQGMAEPVALVQESTARSISVGSAKGSESTQFESEPEPEPIEIQAPIEPEPEPAMVEKVDPGPTVTQPVSTYENALEPIESKASEQETAELELPTSEPSHTKEREPKAPQENPILTRPPVSRPQSHESHQPPANVRNVFVTVENEPVVEPLQSVSKPVTPKAIIPESVATRPATPKPDILKEPETSQGDPGPIGPPVARPQSQAGDNRLPAGVKDVSVPFKHESVDKADPIAFNPTTPQPATPKSAVHLPATPRPASPKKTGTSHTEPPAPSPQPRPKPSQPPVSIQPAPAPSIILAPKREDPAASTRRIALIAIVSVTVLWVTMFAVFLAGARFGGGRRLPAPPSARGPCEPGYVFAQTRRLSAHTTFFEGLMTFPEPQTLEDGQECPVSRNMEVASEIVPAQL